MKSSLRFLAERLQYDVPQQDLRIDRTRLPALPRDRFVITRVRLTERAAAPPADPAVERPTHASSFDQRP